MRYHYHPWSPNCRKTTALIDHLGIDAEPVVVDLAQGAQMAPDFLAVNPNGMVPVLEDGERTILESNTIMIYLGEKESSDLWPVRRLVQLEVLQWMFWEQSHFMFACGTVFFNRMIKPMIGQESDEAQVEQAITKFRRHAKVLDSAVDGKNYLVGDALSLADWAVAGHLSFAGPCGLPVADFPEVERWLARLDETPAWKASVPQPG